MKQTHSLARDRSSFFVLLIMSAVLVLLMWAGSISWLTERLVSDIGMLLASWLVAIFALNLILTTLSRRITVWLWAVMEEEAAAPAEEEPAVSEDQPVAPPGEEKLLRYLALRTTLQWHYRADPYREGGDVTDNYHPMEFVLSRHVYEKLVAWAERNAVSLSDAAERMLLNGMADEHLANIIREEGWGDDRPEEGA